MTGRPYDAAAPLDAAVCRLFEHYYRSSSVGGSWSSLLRGLLSSSASVALSRSFSCRSASTCAGWGGGAVTAVMFASDRPYSATH